MREMLALAGTFVAQVAIVAASVVAVVLVVRFAIFVWRILNEEMKLREPF